MRPAGADVPPRVGITVGDPAGIGPEIVLKSLDAPEVRLGCRPILIGDAADLNRQADSLGLHCHYESFQLQESLPLNPSGPVVFDTQAIEGTINKGTVSAQSV